MIFESLKWNRYIEFRSRETVNSTLKYWLNIYKQLLFLRIWCSHYYLLWLEILYACKFCVSTNRQWVINLLIPDLLRPGLHVCFLASSSTHNNEPTSDTSSVTVTGNGTVSTNPGSPRRTAALFWSPISSFDLLYWTGHMELWLQ